MRSLRYLGNFEFSSILVEITEYICAAPFFDSFPYIFLCNLERTTQIWCDVDTNYSHELHILGDTHFFPPRDVLEGTSEKDQDCSAEECINKRKCPNSDAKKRVFFFSSPKKWRKIIPTSRTNGFPK